MTKKVCLIDYGMGNILSVARAFEYLDCSVKIAESPRDFDFGTTTIIPGVGAFSTAVEKLELLGFKDLLLRVAEDEKPILGICLGMQLLFTEGNENSQSDGLDIIQGSIKQLPKIDQNGSTLKVPHIGWTNTYIDEKCALERSVNVDQHVAFYYVHSYYAQPTDPNQIKGWYERGGQKIPAFVKNKNNIGVQFHPEKSGKVGLEFLGNLLKYL